MKKCHNRGVFLLRKIKEKYMSEIRFSSKAHEQLLHEGGQTGNMRTSMDADCLSKVFYNVDKAMQKCFYIT